MALFPLFGLSSGFSSIRTTPTIGYKGGNDQRSHKTCSRLLCKIKRAIFGWTLTSVHPQTASFGPERRFRSFEILDIARYACGFKIAQALL